MGISIQTVQFLNESNRIEGISSIDYSNRAFQDPSKGHYGAYCLSQRVAVNHQPLSVKMIRSWQGLLCKEQQESSGVAIADEEIGHIRNPSLPKNVRIGKHVPPHYTNVPNLLQMLVEDINEDLAKHHTEYEADNEAFVRSAGSFFLKFEKIHPFADGNGRVGRLIANYFATYCNKPILIFPSEYSLRNRYIEAHENEEAMTTYFQARLNEAFL